MTAMRRSSWRKRLHLGLRKALALLPRETRYSFFGDSSIAIRPRMSASR